MPNFQWSYKFLQPSDLPEKAQRFIEIMNIDKSFLRLMLLKANPNGRFLKSFDRLEERKPGGNWAAIAEIDTVYFFEEYPQVKIVIHELTHIYLTHSLNKGIKYNLKAIAEKFVVDHGMMALTSYAIYSFFENDWEEVICEIVATYGRRGQFNEIQELFNQSKT